MVRPAIAGHFVIGPLCACWPTMVPRQGQIELAGCTKAISPGNYSELGASLEGLDCVSSGIPRPFAERSMISGSSTFLHDPGRPSDFPELRGAVRPHAFGWPTLFPVRYLWSLHRWEGQCMGAVVEPRKRPHCLMCFGYGETKNFKIKNALFRECWTRTYELQRHRHAYRWGWHHVKAKSCH